MNIQNSEAKIGAVHELGCRLDDTLEHASKDLYRSEGAISALKQALGVFENLTSAASKEVDALIDEGKINLEQAKIIKAYVDKGRQQINNLVLAADNNRIVQSGKVQAFEQAVQLTKKFKDDEMNKLKMLADAIAAGHVKKTQEGLVHTGEGARPVGIRPGMTLKERRLAEATDNSDKADSISVKEDKVKSKTKKVKK